jgi:hypothetical protein
VDFLVLGSVKDRISANESKLQFYSECLPTRINAGNNILHGENGWLNIVGLQGWYFFQKIKGFIGSKKHIQDVFQKHIQ